MKFTNLLIAASAAVLLTTGAQAATYDAFTSFDGTQGAGGFFYGDLANELLPISLYAANTNCFIDGSTCLQRSANHDVPGYTKSTSPSFQYGTVDVPTNELLAHPANDSTLATVLFLVSQPGTYTITARFEAVDRSPTGVDLFTVFASQGHLPSTITNVGSLPAASGSSFLFADKRTFAAGDVFGLAIGNGGFYGNDSTGVNFTLTSVPEPATWSLMIVGFGAVGFAMRRRSATSTVTYA
jgi:hypothetical protein